jgi:hypothetical protein
MVPTNRAVHKVLTYIKYRAVSGVFRTIDPPLPLHPASVSSPRTKGRGVHTRRAVRGGGSIFRKTPDIGLVSYSIIPLRCSATMSEFAVRTPETIVLRPCKLHWQYMTMTIVIVVNEICCSLYITVRPLCIVLISPEYCIRLLLTYAMLGFIQIPDSY